VSEASDLKRLLGAYRLFCAKNFTAHSGDLANELSRVEPAGGQVLQGKTQISEEHGYMALFIDCEGNRVALHSRE